MKALLRAAMIAAIALGAAMMTSCEQSEKAPNPELGDSFRNMFPKAKQVKWETERGYWVADFRDGGYDREAWFDKRNSWVLTKTEYDRKAPKAIKDAVGKTEYKDWRINDVDHIEKRGNPLGTKEKSSFYIVEVENGEKEVDLYFSDKGKFIKKVTGDGDYHREL